MPQRDERQTGILALIVLSLVFASMGIFSRYLSVFSLLQQVYLRVAAAAVLAVIVFWKDLDFSKFKKIGNKEWSLILFRSLSLYVFGVTLLTAGFLSAKYANVSFISNLPFTAVLGILLFKERLTLQKAGLIFLAFLGATLIATGNMSELFVWGRGETLTALAALSFSFSYVARKWHSELLNDKELTVLILLVSFLLLFAASLIKGENLPAQGWTPLIFIAVIGAGIFNIINLFLTNYGFKRVEAILAGNILTLEAFFGLIIGLVGYHEIPTFRGLFGGALIVAGVVGMNSLHKKRRRTL